MKFSSRSRREDLHIDLTPMIDVVFQLVLFLVLATSIRQPEEGEQKDPAGIQVDLPKASATAVISAGQDLNVWISGDGSLYLGDAAIQPPALQRAFREAAGRDSGTLVIIKADRGTSHGRVVTVMDLARAEGLTRLAIATESEEP